MRILDSSLLVVSGCFVAVIGASSLPRQSARAESTAIAAQQAALPAYCAGATDHTLPLPTSLTPDAFHDRLLAFLQNTEYVKLNWCVDKGVRDTGPFVNGKYLGTHPAVRIYYSPTVMKWLINGREGELPDGAMMVKEMYLPPAARWEGQPLVRRVVDRDDQGREGIARRVVLGRVGEHAANSETERQLEAAVHRAR